MGIRYAAIKKNDIVDGEGICVSFWCQGCPFHCVGCHNPNTWDFKGGIEDSEENIIALIDNALVANNVHRNLSILGGEPLCESNIWFTDHLIHWCREHYPQAKIYLWTGYTYDNCNPHQQKLIRECDVTIDGPFLIDKRDISLPLRGSSNQRILRKGVDY